MVPSKKVGAAVIAIVAAIVILYFWRPWRRDFNEDLEQQYVDKLTVNVDGKSFPETIRSGETHLAVIRFQVPVQREGETYRAFLMVVGPDGYEYGGKADLIEAFHQSRDPNAPGVSLTASRNGRSVDMTPEPPPEGAPYQQYCCLIHSSAFKNNGDSSGPREAHLWLYPKEKGPKPSDKISSAGHLVFIQHFHYERAAEK